MAFTVFEPLTASCPQLDTMGVTVSSSGTIRLRRSTSVYVIFQLRPFFRPL